jgi:serine protease AprX
MLAAALTAGLLISGDASAGTRLPVKLDRDLLAPGANGRAIIGFDHDVTAGTVKRLRAAGITQAVKLEIIDAVGVIGTQDAYRQIARWKDVRFVDADSRIRFDNHVAKKDTRVDEVRAGKGRMSKYNGKGVTVAVIDTGIESTHQDLDDRVVKHVNFEPAWFFDMINDGVYSDQVAEATGNPLDSYGHGTHVAGIVAGTGEAADGKQDMSGVAPGASLVNLKIADVHQGVDCSLPCDIGWEMNALVAYEWAIEHRNDKVFPGGIRVINNSWSTYEVDSEVEPISLIVAAASKKGLISVFAAGNDGPGKNTVAEGPNRLESVITVAAACKSSDSCGKGKIADFSSRGPQVDIAAPGDNIYSTLARASAFGPIGSHNPPGGQADAIDYVGLSGTSMATPHVAGIVALMLDANPKLKRAQVEKILIKTSVDRGQDGFDTSWGYGMVDAYSAVKVARSLGK